MLVVGSIKQRAQAAIAAAALVVAGSAGTTAAQPKTGVESCDGVKPSTGEGVCPVPKNDPRLSELSMSPDFRPVTVEGLGSHGLAQAEAEGGPVSSSQAQKPSAWKRALAWFSGLSSLAMIYPYIQNVIRGVAQANPTSFAIWIVNDAAVTGNALASGDPNTFMLGLGWTLSSVLCLGVALRWGNRRTRGVDVATDASDQKTALFNPL